MLNEVLEAEGTGLAFSELRYTFGGVSIVPDIVVLSRDRIPKDEDGDIADVIKVAPNAAIEILSPQQVSAGSLAGYRYSARYDDLAS